MEDNHVVGLTWDKINYLTNVNSSRMNKRYELLLEVMHVWHVEVGWYTKKRQVFMVEKL